MRDSRRVRVLKIDETRPQQVDDDVVIEEPLEIRVNGEKKELSKIRREMKKRDRVRTADNLDSERRLASTRLVVESTISNLKCQMRLEHHLAKTPTGLVQRIAQRLLALTLGMFINALTGRPPRSLVAYDGR